MTSLTLTLDPVVRLTREQFYALCEVNSDIRLEQNRQVGHATAQDG